MTNTFMIDRVRDRVEELGKSPITISREAGLERGYIRDLISGKKKSIRGDKLAAVARALDCDPEYITGEQDIIRRERREPDGRNVTAGIPFGGICETGTWRTPAAQLSGTSDRAPIEPDPEYPGMPNIAFLVRGDGMAGEQIFDGFIAAGIEARAWQTAASGFRDGSIVAARRVRRSTGDEELSLRRLVVKTTGTWLEACPGPGGGTYEPFELGPDAEILAVITRVIRRLPTTF